MSKGRKPGAALKIIDFSQLDSGKLKRKMYQSEDPPPIRHRIGYMAGGGGLPRERGNNNLANKLNYTPRELINSHSKSLVGHHPHPLKLARVSTNNTETIETAEDWRDLAMSGQSIDPNRIIVSNSLNFRGKGVEKGNEGENLLRADLEGDQMSVDIMRNPMNYVESMENNYYIPPANIILSPEIDPDNPLIKLPALPCVKRRWPISNIQGRKGYGFCKYTQRGNEEISLMRQKIAVLKHKWREVPLEDLTLPLLELGMGIKPKTQQIVNLGLKKCSKKYKSTCMSPPRGESGGNKIPIPIHSLRKQEEEVLCEQRWNEEIYNGGFSYGKAQKRVLTHGRGSPVPHVEDSTNKLYWKQGLQSSNASISHEGRQSADMSEVEALCTSILKEKRGEGQKLKQLNVHHYKIKSKGSISEPFRLPFGGHHPPNIGKESNGMQSNNLMSVPMRVLNQLLQNEGHRPPKINKGGVEDKGLLDGVIGVQTGDVKGRGQLLNSRNCFSTLTQIKEKRLSSRGTSDNLRAIRTSESKSSMDMNTPYRSNMSKYSMQQLNRESLEKSEGEEEEDDQEQLVEELFGEDDEDEFEHIEPTQNPDITVIHCARGPRNSKVFATGDNISTFKPINKEDRITTKLYNNKISTKGSINTNPKVYGGNSTAISPNINMNNVNMNKSESQKILPNSPSKRKIFYPTTTRRGTNNKNYFSGINPKNQEKEKENFFKSDYHYNPVFEYEGTKEVKILKMFKEPKGELLPVAERIMKAFLEKYTSYTNYLEVDGGRILTREETEEIFRTYIDNLNLGDFIKLTFSSNTISPTSITHDFRSGMSTITIGLPIEYRQNRILGVLNHEIGTHFLRRYNDRSQLWTTARRKYEMKPYIITEEGLAALNQIYTHVLLYNIYNIYRRQIQIEGHFCLNPH